MYKKIMQSPHFEQRAWLLSTYEAAYFSDIVKTNVPEVHDLQPRWLVRLAVSHTDVLGLIGLLQNLRSILD